MQQLNLNQSHGRIKLLNPRCTQFENNLCQNLATTEFESITLLNPRCNQFAQIHHKCFRTQERKMASAVKIVMIEVQKLTLLYNPQLKSQN